MYEKERTRRMGGDIRKKSHKTDGIGWRVERDMNILGTNIGLEVGAVDRNSVVVVRRRED